MQKSSQMAIFKDLCVYLPLYQSLYDLTNPTVCNLKPVIVFMNALGHNLISVLGFTNPLGHRLVLTSHLECQAILLILLCLAAPFLTALGCFSLAYTLQIRLVT